ncbi:ATP-binding protein, partial [Bacteroidota bacterium]
LENLNEVEKLIDEISEDFELDTDLYGKILIATIEAVNNSIIHGNKLSPDKKVVVRVKGVDKEVHIIVSDEGPGFDFYDVPDPTTPENIENIHGRGIFLMKNLADGVIFTDDGKSVELIFKI